MERAGILSKLKYLDFQIIIPKHVSLEFGKIELENVKIENLKGRSIKKVKSLISKGFGWGDDRKLLRQKYMLEDKILKDIEIVGFSFIIHILFKKKQISDVWKAFDDIIEKNNWQRSEVEAANFVFLKEMRY